jgi:diguanylate cyclase (GGDEF)-like protein
MDWPEFEPNMIAAGSDAPASPAPGVPAPPSPRRAQALERLLELNLAIMEEPDATALMNRVVAEARRFTNAEAGTLFLRQGADLAFAVVQNDHLVRIVGPRGLKALLEGARLPVDRPSLAGFTARTGEVLNIPNAYEIAEDAPYRFDAAWDTKNYYHTRSVLLVPLTDRAGNNVGVLQLINARDEHGEVIPFARADEPLVRALAAQAALAIENSRLAELSFVDALTGAYNRRYFRLRLEEEIKRYRRSHQPFALVLFDVDNFKAINDTHGHVVGDSALTTISQLLTGQSRGFTVLSRLGGDEFGAVLIDTPKPGALEYAERIRRLVEAYPFAHGRVTMSGGVISVPADETDVDQLGYERLVHAADQMLYEAKRGGRNSVRWPQQGASATR